MNLDLFARGAYKELRVVNPHTHTVKEGESGRVFGVPAYQRQQTVSIVHILHLFMMLIRVDNYFFCILYGKFI